MRRSPERAAAARSALAECRRLAAARATPRPLEAALMLHGETHAGSDPCPAAPWRRAALELAHAYPAARGAASAVGMLLLQAEQAAAPQARSAAQRRRILAVRPVGMRFNIELKRLQHCSGGALPLTSTASVLMALACPVFICRQPRRSVLRSTAHGAALLLQYHEQNNIRTCPLAGYLA
jgi:hypothetical protein